MKLTNTQLDLAADYIKGELSGNVLSDFEATLAANRVLREEVAFQRDILSALRFNVALNMIEQATRDNLLLRDVTLHPEFERTQSVAQQARIANINRQRRIRNWAMSGLAVAACVLGLFFFARTIIYNHHLNNEIASWEITFDSGSRFEDVGSADAMDKQIETAKIQYAEGNPKAALATLNQIEGEVPAHILLAKGQIQAKLKNYKESESSLLLVVTTSNKENIKDDARLALVTVCLRLGKKEAAQEQLGQITNEPKKREAEEVLKKYQRKTIL